MSSILRVAVYAVAPNELSREVDPIAFYHSVDPILHPRARPSIQRKIRAQEPRRALCASALRACRCIAAAIVGLAIAEPARADTALPTVILISLDGTRSRDLNEHDTPTLMKLARAGLRAERLIPAVPTNTFPNHVTLVTGVAPERHGIVNNRFVDPERGAFGKQDIPSWIQVEPLWSLLARRGVVSASYYWVGSEGPWPGGKGPLHWLEFSSRTREDEKVRQILAWLDIADDARRPRFITSWFHGADHAAHVHGPGHAEARRALRAQEPAIAALVAGIEARGLFSSTTLIFVSDHGMSAVDKRVEIGEALRQAGIPSHTTGIGGFASVYLENPSPAEIDRAVAVAEGLGLSAVPRVGAPASLRIANPRFGDIVLQAPMGTAISHAGLQLEGFHGYRPDEPEMAGLFIAAGRGVAPAARLSSVRSIDVAPTVLSLLGLDVPSWMEGRPIAALGLQVDPEAGSQLHRRPGSEVAGETFK